MATVRMKKGEKYADVYDSPETIRQAQLDGYSLVEEKKEVKQEPKVEEPKTEELKLETPKTEPPKAAETKAAKPAAKTK